MTAWASGTDSLGLVCHSVSRVISHHLLDPVSKPRGQLEQAGENRDTNPGNFLWPTVAEVERACEATYEGEIRNHRVPWARVFGPFPESNRELPVGCFNFNILSTKQNEFSSLLM